MNLRNFPEATPNAHLSGFNFMQNILSMLNILAKCDVVGGDLDLDDHVVYIDLHCLADLFFEHHVDKRLVGRASVLKSKSHHFVAIQVAIYHERGVFSIWDIHGDLVVPRISIYEAEQLMSRGRVHELINSQKWEVVLWASFVEFGEVYIGPSLAIGLFH